jgi:putative FmdB family regulatory protein
MPLYEYRCDACNHEFEALQKISDEALVHCPACEAPALRKLVSAAGFRLKGDGWYETDFKTGSKRNLAENAGKADAAKKSEAAACGSSCGCH